MRLRLLRGDISRARASCIVTSANDALVGNEQPLYWRLTSRKNVDGAVREAAGPQLRQACLEFPALEAAVDAMEEEPRDISRWAETAKRGSSTTLRCAPGAAVVTRGFGLDCDWCVHAVAPDSEFGYEGHYQGQPGIRGEEVRARSSPPLRRLRQTYEAALAACHRRGAETAALPALGAGVKGWRPSISAAMCLDALCRDAERGRFAEVSVVLGSDDAWVAFGKAFSALVGDADEDVSAGERVWHVADADARLPFDGDDATLDLARIPELAPRPAANTRGYSGDFWNPTNNGWR